jgi:uncharacterized membrane protein
MTHFSISGSRTLKGLLLASLCLNVLLGAFIVTRWVEGVRNPMVAASPPQLIEIFARRLPRADADILRRVYRGKEQRFATGQADYQASLAAAALLVAQPQLDGAALRKAVGEARDKRISIGDLAIETLLEALPQMSIEGRRGLLARLRPH